jgi:saccharopine dehydrogenase-like NADP-dependent oxidoreductase
MKKRCIVLGCGLVGATIARDLAGDESLDVSIADLSPRNLARVKGNANLKTIEADLGKPDSINALVKDVDLVVGAMPSVLGRMVLKSVIEAGKPFADISFMAEDALELDNLAKQHNVTAVVDCGVAPGLANMIIGHCAAQLDQTDSVVFYVGGLPKHPKWMYQYKAPFAPSDVVEEYTRPARMKENGKVVSKPALSEPEILEFPRAGKLEAFNTDGLRSLLRTIDAPNMKEKTLRYPGHIQLMRILRETGFFGKEEIEVRGVKVRPLDVTSKLLFPMWELTPGEEEFTVLRVIVEGRKDGKRMRHTYDLYDEYDPKTGQSSMARTTGFPCAIVARMLAHGEITQKGVLAPEMLGKTGMLDLMVSELASRGVMITESSN